MDDELEHWCVSVGSLIITNVLLCSGKVLDSGGHCVCQDTGSMGSPCTFYLLLSYSVNLKPL